MNSLNNVIFLFLKRPNNYHFAIEQLQLTWSFIGVLVGDTVSVGISCSIVQILLQHSVKDVGNNKASVFSLKRLLFFLEVKK